VAGPLFAIASGGGQVFCIVLTFDDFVKRFPFVGGDLPLAGSGWALVHRPQRGGHQGDAACRWHKGVNREGRGHGNLPAL